MFDSFANLLYTVGTNLLTISIKKALLGAGLGLATYEGLTTLFDSMMTQAMNSLKYGDSKVLAIVGITGIDVALSVIVSACVIRATIASSSVILTKFE